MSKKLKNKTHNLFKNIAKNYLSPIPKMTVSEWADKYRVISQNNAFPGRWKTKRAPYQKDIMDATTDSRIKKIVVMSASQIGKSDIMNNIIGRFAHLDPCSIMLVQPTLTTAQDYSKSRIAPMIRDTSILKKVFKEEKSRSGENTILSKFFTGGRLVITGSNSPSDLSSKPMRILLFDEVDRFEASAGTEGSPIALAEKRQTTYWNKLTALFSSPGIKGFSRIEGEYNLGTQEEWQHECPNCNVYHLIKFKDISWQAEEIKSIDKANDIIETNYIVSDIKYICPDCGFSFTEEEMKAQKQKYISNNPEAIKNGTRSFLVNGFTPSWIAWEEIIKEYLNAQHDEEAMKVLINTRFAETYEVKGSVEDIQPLLDGREDYGAELPDGVLFLTAAVDVQDNRLEYEVCGWAENEECWGIEKGVVLGVPDQALTWNKLDDVLDRTYCFSDSRTLKIARTFIDTGGHYSDEVYKYCLDNYRKQRIAIKGSTNFNAPLIDRLGKPKRYNIPLVFVGVSQGKQYVFERLLKEDDGSNARRFHFPKEETKGYNIQYFKGLVSEQLVKKKLKGRWVMVWENISSDGRNEPLDLRVYNLACLRSCEPINWDKYKNKQIEKIAKATQKKKQSQRYYGVINRGQEGGLLDA